MALKKRQEERKKRQKERAVSTSYAQATNSTSGNALRAQMTGLMCVLNAHLVNFGQPGSFQRTLSESLSKNGLSDVQLPPNPPTAAIVNALRACLNAGTLPSPPPQPKQAQETATVNTDHLESEESEEESSESPDSEEAPQETQNQEKKMLKILLVKQDTDK